MVYYRVSNATVSVANVENAHHSTRLLAQTTLRNILGTKSLHEILSDRESISNSMQVICIHHQLDDDERKSSSQALQIGQAFIDDLQSSLSSIFCQSIPNPAI